MNREEAIDRLKGLFGNGYSKQEEALNMAIKALEQEPCEDAIDRKLVCAFIAGLISDDGERKKGLEYIRNMPPVNPQPCEEAISRAEAVRVASGYCHPANVAKDLAKLPPVTPRPKWIPASERLPEFGIEVLTCSNGGFIEIQSLEESYGGYWENQKGDWSDFDEIIAWMPLPKPYESQESEEV